MIAPDRHGWQDPRILAMLFFVFLCGSAVGALTMRYRLHEILHNQRIFNTDAAAMSYDRLKTELNLTPEQASKLRGILDDFVVYHHDIQAQVESYRATGKNRILQILNPDQRTRFEKICDQLAR